MTAEPMSVELHAAVLRRRVEARRLVEEARDLAEHERSESWSAAG